MVHGSLPKEGLKFVELLKSLVGKPGWDYSERREKLRVKCRIETSVLYRGGLISAEILDISATGMKLLCRSRVGKNKLIKLAGVELDSRAKLQEVSCETRWVSRSPRGWLVGVNTLTAMEDISESWLAWQLREKRLKLVTADQRRKNVRVNCELPATFLTRDQKLEARVLNLSTEGAFVQTFGRAIEEGSKVALTFGPHDGLPKVRLKAVVISAQGASTRAYGVKFVEIESPERRALGRYMAELLRKS